MRPRMNCLIFKKAEFCCWK